MKKWKQAALKWVAFSVSLLLLLSLVPTSLLHTAAADEKLTIGVMNDLHYFAPALMGSDVQAFIAASKLNSTTSYLAEALLDNALYEYAQQAKEKGVRYLLIPGDLTKNGEYASHKALAARLERFERESGIEVLVINGNHDVRNHKAAKFENGNFVPTEYIEPADFQTIYQNLGYDHAVATFVPPTGEEAGGLSYAADIEGGFRVLALDGGCYSPDSNSKGENQAETRGAYSEALLQWALAQIADAKAKGLTVIGLTHFNLVEHFACEDNLFTAFPIENWQEICETFADAGMHFAFTGHIHLSDIASHTSDNGETLTDCSSASMLNFPCYLRVVTLEKSGATDVTATYESVDIDRSRPVTAFGQTYPKPFRLSAFALNFGGSDINSFANNYIRYLLQYDFIPKMKKSGGLYLYLAAQMDLNAALDSLLASDSGIGAIAGVTKVSLKLLIKNVCDQLEEAYLDGGAKTERLLRVLSDAIYKVTSIPVSDKPCTKYLDTYGFGNANRKGNLGDMASTVLATFYGGDENRTDDAFLNDALARFERGETADVILNTLIDVVLHDLLEEELLQNIRIDLVGILRNTNDADTQVILGEVITQLVEAGDRRGTNGLLPAPTLAQIINLFFAAGLVEYKSLDDVVRHYMDEYLTPSQYETIAYEFYNILSDLTTDENPAPQADNFATVRYNGKVPVTATVENLRLPSGIAVTFGADAATMRNICWYTKVGVEGTDIEIVPYSKHPKFSGTPTTGSHIVTQTKRVTREMPGVDLGVFGIISHTFDVNRHMIKIGGLKAGQKYCYRVGDASRGWWSDVGVFETADTTDCFTFFHMSDSQGGIERQYGVWADVVDTAYTLYPEAEFIMHTGDVVDSGKNFKQWNWVLNTASKNLMRTVLMPTTGNHEKNGAYATVNNFLLSDLPQQNTETGVYYSFDYKNAHFMVLNTNDLNDDNTLGTKQLEWLAEDAASSEKPWKIVALHKAVYSNGSHYDDKDVVALRKQLSVLMPKLGIDVVLQGHDHVYLRTTAMQDNAVCTVTERTITKNGTPYTAMVQPDGTVYVIDGCAGVKYYQTKDAALTDSLFPRAESLYDATAPVFSAIQIDGENLFFDAYTVQNGVAQKIDSFAISKGDMPSAAPDTDSAQTGNANVPKTAGKSMSTLFFLLIPAAVTTTVGGGAIRRKRKEEQ